MTDLRTNTAFLTFGLGPRANLAAGRNAVETREIAPEAEQSGHLPFAQDVGGNVRENDIADVREPRTTIMCGCVQLSLCTASGL